MKKCWTNNTKRCVFGELPGLGWAVASLICLLACSGPKKPAVQEKEFEGYLPSKEGHILATVETESRDSLLCLHKSLVLAKDRLEMTIEKVLTSFKEEWSQNGSLVPWLPAFEEFKIYGVLKARDYSFHLQTDFRKREPLYVCNTTVHIKLKNILRVIEEEAKRDSVLEASIKSSQFFQKIKRKSKGIWSTADAPRQADSTGDPESNSGSEEIPTEGILPLYPDSLLRDTSEQTPMTP